MGREGAEAMGGPGTTERLLRRLETAVSAYEQVELKPDLADIAAFAKVGVELGRWDKQMQDIRFATRRADAQGHKTEALLHSLLIKAFKPANDAATPPPPITEGTDMDDDGNPQSPAELAEFNEWVARQFGGLAGAPEQKAFRNRAERRRERSLSKPVGGTGARGATRA